jgi:hypothetical protein
MSNDKDLRVLADEAINEAEHVIVQQAIAHELRHVYGSYESLVEGRSRLAAALPTKDNFDPGADIDDLVHAIQAINVKLKDEERTFSPRDYGWTKAKIADEVNSWIDDEDLPCVRVDEISDDDAQDFVNMLYEAQLDLSDGWRSGWPDEGEGLKNWIHGLASRK